MDWVLGKVVDQSDCGASAVNTKITDLVFADDAVIFAESLEVLVMAHEALHEEAKPLGLEVSWLKTKDQNRKPTIAANIKREVGRKLRTPNVTRWNSLLKDLSEVLDTKLAQINVMCMHNGISTFNQVDKDIINEYLTVMKPVVTSLDKLQMERETYMGVLLPTLSILWDSLRALKAKPFKYPRPLLEYLLENPHSDKRPKGFKARFLSLFDQRDILLATAIHPLFKLPVVRLINREKVEAMKSRLLFEVTEKAVLDTSEGSSPDEDEEDDFFKMCLLSTAIPSSADVDKLFAQGSDIMKAKRASLTTDNFERLVFMKGNMDQPIWNCHQRTLNEESEVKGLIS
ncbi:hypothetical protein GWK47_043129 [Chionoecetes opilio]|uniref:HAT C-terminal dimerisation domain-containing protein n=1 Tax=Chionoecetes opilio TaxID=41210 RepID=A0A8J4Y9J6_CHIOP|nr:hypothetical protein GWK47_043129 [Chionoecetes opilio]